jgi:hypothetical protein
MSLAQMSPEQRGAYQQQMQQGQRRQGAARLGAGALDFFGGRKAQQEAEGQIEELGGQADAIRNELEGMRAPGSMDPNTVAEATRNAAILGFQTPAEDPADDLAAQAMALESGADPSKLYAQAMKQESAEDAQRRAEAQGQFGQGLQMSQTDALNRFKQDYQQRASELDAVNQELSAAQQESLAAQQRKARGAQVGLAGAGQFAQAGGIDEIKAALGGQPSEEEKGELTAAERALEPKAGGVDFSDGQPIIASDATRNPELQLNEGQTASGFLAALDSFHRPAEEENQAQGGSVQQTPGKYDHDTNDMMLMAQGKHGQLVDTGIRQTGGEYVIDPFDAGNMRQGFDKIDPLELEAVRTGRAELRPELVDDLMQLYDAVRFVKEPQFQDDYYEKKMNGYA